MHWRVYPPYISAYKLPIWVSVLHTPPWVQHRLQNPGQCFVWKLVPLSRGEEKMMDNLTRSVWDQWLLVPHQMSCSVPALAELVPGRQPRWQWLYGGGLRLLRNEGCCSLAPKPSGCSGASCDLVLRTGTHQQDTQRGGDTDLYRFAAPSFQRLSRALSHIRSSSYAPSPNLLPILN